MNNDIAKIVLQYLDYGDLTNLKSDFDYKFQFLEDNIEKIDWKILLIEQDLPTFFEKHLDRVNWKYISANSNLKSSFLEKYIDNLDFKNLKNHKFLSETFICKYREKLWLYEIDSGDDPIQTTNTSFDNYDYVDEEMNNSSTYKNYATYRILWDFDKTITKEYVEQLKNSDNNINNINYIPWLKTTTNFVDKHKNKLWWERISYSANLSIDFIERYVDYIDWQGLSINKYINDRFITKHKDRLLKLIGSDKLFFNEKLSMDFVEKNKNNIDWLILSAYNYIPKLIIDKYMNYIHWDSFFQFQKCHICIFNNYIDKVNWESIYSIFSNKTISVEFCQKYYEKINWHWLCYNDEFINNLKYKELCSYLLTIIV
jgi:hypothetical protein